MKWIAHRGNHLQTVENSMKAFENALSDIYDGCECDIRLTSDKAFIVYHDDTFKRLNGKKMKVSETTLIEATSMTYLDDQEQTIISLEQLLKFFHQKQTYLFIEIKDKLNECQIKSLLKLLKRYEIHYMLISFHLEVLLQISGFECMWLVDKMNQKVINRVSELPINHLGCNVKYMTDKRLNQAIEAGIDISLWTVNTHQAYWSNQHVQFITTDHKI